MRNNQPVTNVEYVLKETDSIVSKTDLKGAITYVNPDFLRISGFVEAELIGTSHNIVRHPDMPIEAFADLWATLKANRPWTGLVKNRCKNGDYYWVRANATPIFDNGQCVGYMSVRSKPSRADVEAHERVYSMFRNGQQGGLQIKGGKAVKFSLIGKLNLLKKTTIKFRMLLVLILMSVLLLSIGVIGLSGMSKTRDGMTSVFSNSVIPMSRLFEIQKLMLANRLLVVSSLTKPTSGYIKKSTEEIERNIKKISAIWKDFITNTYLAPEDKVLVDTYAETRKRFVVKGLKATITALRANDIPLASKIVLDEVPALYDVASEASKALLDMQISDTKIELENSISRYESARIEMIVIVLLGVLFAIWAIMMLIFDVLRPLHKVMALLQSVSQGKFDNDINSMRPDEIGKLMDTLQSMQIRMGFDAADAYRIASENLRIRIGLDNVSTSVMIADTERTIIYINKAANELMHKTESDLRKDLPNFSADKLLGGSIDGFHKNPAHQKSMLESLNSTHRTQVVVGGRTFALAANPVINTDGTRLGAALEWQDRTTEVAVEMEVANIVEASVMGDFSQRIDMQGKEAFFKQLGDGINQLMDTSERGLNEVVRMLGSLAQGDLTDRITNDYQGTFGQLKDDANATSDKLKEILGQIRRSTDTIGTASKEIASGNVDLSQRTEEQASSLEETAASMEELTSTVKLNADNAKQANQLAHSASAVAEKGGAVVQEVVGTMSSINDSSRKVVDIISVIDGIAFQTNILALNAAVEAARAGEQGRGFAVVAAEVRNLAQRSAAAAKEIKTLIGDSVEKVEVGSKLVNDAGKTMEEIVNAVKRVTDIMAEISAASTEQSQGIEQVSQAITQMDDVTQQNAALVEEAAAAAESLEEEAQTLTIAVSVFKVDEMPHVRIAAPRAVKRSAAKNAVAGKPKALPPKLSKPSSEEWEEF
ncbi:MAG: methyl-accepting chemotaxis protein [Gallionellaceae bacterium]